MRQTAILYWRPDQRMVFIVKLTDCGDKESIFGLELGLAPTDVMLLACPEADVHCCKELVNSSCQL